MPSDRQHVVSRARRRRGFTLVELMVAVTGGLFMSIVVFVLARDGARFYQRESRLADATFAGIVGFERLRVDIGRAGFMSSPNIRRDPRVCGKPDGNWPLLLGRLESFTIAPGPPMPAPLLAKGIAPDRITLAGSFASVEQFPARTPVDTGSEYHIYLQVNSGPMVRLGYQAATTPQVQTALLDSVFGIGRAIRIVDRAGGQHFGTITGTSNGDQPYVRVSRTPPLTFRHDMGAMCGFRGHETGALVNVVNFVRYDVRDLRGNSSYASLYNSSSGIPYDSTRTELVRAELDTAGTVIAGTEELVAEYVVDLKFGITVVDSVLNGTDPSLETFAPGSPEIATWAGQTPALTHLARAIRVRLSVRSRDADRESPVSTLPGLYRVGLGNGGGAPYARVRTVQADIALRNQMRPLWGM
jgi:hypothetical protein